VFYFSLRNSDYKSADRTAVAYFTVVVLGSKMNTASFFSGIDWHERCTYSCTLFVCNQRNTTGDDGLRHVAPIGEAGCGTGGTQWCARHVGSQGQVSSPPGFRLHRHLLMPPLFVLFHFSRTAVVCCACPASRSDRGVLSGCGGLARLTRPVARPGRLTARVPTSPASVDAPIFFLCHSTSTAVVCCLLPCRPL
jgi:hypothetical protein